MYFRVTTISSSSEDEDFGEGVRGRGSSTPIKKEPRSPVLEGAAMALKNWFSGAVGGEEKEEEKEEEAKNQK